MQGRSCAQCLALCRSRSRIVWGGHATNKHYIPGTIDTTVVLIGEAPGYGEDKAGVPFAPFAKTGKEVRKILWRMGLDSITYITNLVKCHPANDRDPTQDEINACAAQWLVQEIELCRPRLIVTAGRFSTWYMLGRSDFTMEMVSGIAYTTTAWGSTIILPMIHPAAGLRQQKALTFVMDAFKSIPDILSGKIKPVPLPKPENPDHVDYRVATSPADLHNYLEKGAGIIAIDTEADHDNGTFCATVSNMPTTSRMIMGDDQNTLLTLQSYITSTNPVVVIHSALYDIPELFKLNVIPPWFVPQCRLFDTLVAAYMLQDEPLGLKPLAWRYNRIKMQSYVETITPARWGNALTYLYQVCSMEWPDPDPVMEWQKGVPRIKQPQNILKKAKRIIDDTAKGKKDKSGELVDPRKRWLNIKEPDGRGMVQDKIGYMPDGFLSDIPFDEAINYACADADQTLRLYNYMSRRIDKEGLRDAFQDEMGCIWFINDMHEFGIPCDPDHFHGLSVKYKQELEKIEIEITQLSGGVITQLSSHQQVSSLLYDIEKLNLSRHLPKKISKKTGKTMTSDDILAQLKPVHPVVQLIRDHREIAKIRNSYTKKLPKMIGQDGRAHPAFRTTNTATGRLSEEIWMTIPKRSSKAKDVRNGVRALPGCKILSMDYSQIELRLTAEEADEKSMISAFQNGVDLHSLTASEMFKISIADVDKRKHRLPAKTINFGIIYGITAAGLYRNMVVQPGCEHWTVQLAQNYIDEYFRIRPGITAYIAETESMAVRHEKVWDWAGRIRRIPGAKLVDEYLRAEALRQACNMRIQTGAQSIIKKAMVELKPVYDDFCSKGYVCSPMIQIHDSIESMVSEDALPLLVPVQKAIMEQVKPLKAGVRVDAEVGDLWGDLEDYIIKEESRGDC